MNYIKVRSWFLGIATFMFGFLKLFNPFKGWYSIQITESGLGEIAYLPGIVGELVVGITLLVALLMQKKLSARRFAIVIAGACFVLVIIMATGIYVHLHPSVPAEVLPMNIKPPFIPGFFLILALLNAYHLIKLSRDQFAW